jgi:hypothetical protein
MVLFLILDVSDDLRQVARRETERAIAPLSPKERVGRDFMRHQVGGGSLDLFSEKRLRYWSRQFDDQMHMILNTTYCMNRTLQFVAFCLDCGVNSRAHFWCQQG